MGREPGTQRLSRLLEIYLLIAGAPRRWTRARLVQRYELSPRQVQKDLDEIRNRLNPSLRRTWGGYYFDRMPLLAPLIYSLPEALALLRAARAGAVLRGVAADDLHAALDRLQAVLPGELAPLLPSADGRGTVGGDTTRAEKLRMLELAMASRLRVRLTYAAASHDGEIRERLFEPYAVEPYLRSWHVIGYCHLRQAIRTFKVDRIVAIEPTAESYAIPADFDAARYLGAGDAWGVMEGAGGAREEVVLRFSSTAGRWVREEQWHPSQRFEQNIDGSIRMYLFLVITPEFRRWVFSYGTGVDVLAPTHLRCWVAREAKAVLARLEAQRESPGEDSCSGLAEE